MLQACDSILNAKNSNESNLSRKFWSRWTEFEQVVVIVERLGLAEECMCLQIVITVQTIRYINHVISECHLRAFQETIEDLLHV